MGRKTNLAVIFGGKSVEHEVSLRSAKNIVDHIDRNTFDLLLIGIDQKGKWHYLPEFTFDIESGIPIGLSLDQGNEPFFTKIDGESLGRVDIVFPMLHGTDGEDGNIQGLSRIIDLPFVGTGVLGSAVAFDKLCSKRLFAREGIPSAGYMALSIEDRDGISFEKVKDKLGVPFFIKPVASGSSVGVFKVKDKNYFNTVLDDAFQYDNTLLIEEFVEGREIECAVIGNEVVDTSLPGEIRMTGKYDFYSFDAKYVDDAGAQLDMPADLPDDIIKRVQELSKRAYRCLFCEDYSRVDMFLKPDGQILINEINTIPGFTHISMFPQLWTLTGITYTQLITRLIDTAFKKYHRMKRIKRDYESKL